MMVTKETEEQLNGLLHEAPNPTSALVELMGRLGVDDSKTPTSEFKIESVCHTGYATLHMAGDIAHAKALTRKFVMRGACVQLAPCEYVYTGGVESGFTARIIRYPRFPKTIEELTQEAVSLGNLLAEELGQVSFSVETSSQTFYFTHPTFKKK